MPEAIDTNYYPPMSPVDPSELLSPTDLRRQRGYERSQHRVRNVLQKVAAAVGIITCLYAADCLNGYNQLQDTHPEVVDVFGASLPQFDNEATVTMAGFGILDSTPDAAALPAFAKQGRVWAIRYDNKGISAGIIAEEIIAKAKQEHVTEIGFDGHSAGGIEALDVALQIDKRKTDISIPFIILDCTPATIGDVRPSVRDWGYRLDEALKDVPGAKYSRFFRFIGEMAGRHEAYMTGDDPESIDPSEFIKNAAIVLREKFSEFNPNAASTSLLMSQFKMIVASGAKQDILVLGRYSEANQKPEPVIVYMRPGDANVDNTVNDDTSQANFEKFTEKAGLPLLVVKMLGTRHADPVQHPEQYNNAIANKVIPGIIAAIREQSILAEASSTKLDTQNEQAMSGTGAP